MSMVRFATLCNYDRCEKRSSEYTRWPECRECMEEFCPFHQHPGSLKQDDYGRESCLCLSCAAEEVIR